MNITIRINTGNAAFVDNRDELREVLLQVIDRAPNYELNSESSVSSILMDSNGNTVGNVFFHSSKGD